MNQSHNNSNHSYKTSEILDFITLDRTRTNLLRKYEQQAIVYLVQRIPSWVSSNFLTAIGFFGNVIVFLSFVLSWYINDNYLLLGLLGFALSWFGDSLDGRLAYFRKKIRKWYGFALDITFDWIGIILIGCGFIIYVEGIWELLGYSFVIMYGWQMIIALMRYKITGKYSIDSGIFGPTEVRIIISAILITEVLLHGSVNYFAAFVCAVLLIVDITDTRKLLKAADEIDKLEKKK